MTQTKANFLFPGKPIRAYNVSAIPNDYLFQVKKDGHRVIIVCNNDNDLRFFNRHGSLLTSIQKHKHDWDFIKHVFPQPFVLDGEYVGPRQAGSKSNQIYLWDCPIMGGKNNTSTSYYERYLSFVSFFGTTNNNNNHLTLASLHAHSEFSKIFNSLTSVAEDEGVVFKNIKSTLYWSKLSSNKDTNQIKIKK